MDEETPEVPVAPVPQLPKKDNHWITILAMALFVLTALGSTAFLYYQNQQLKAMLASYQAQASPTPIATPDPTANWKTYEDKKYGYEFKYPETWYTGASGDGSILLNDTLFDPKSISEPDQVKIVFEVITKKELIDAYTKMVVVSEKQTASGETFKFVGNTSTKPVFAQILGSDGNLYRFSIPTPVYMNIFNQILSTFQLLNSTPSASPSVVY